jgi:4'-phosphopantetheinyl transferase
MGTTAAPGPGREREPGEALATWWLARGEDELPGAAGWLSAAERSRAGALRYTKRRTDFLLGRWTLKLAVAKALGWPDDPAMLARIEGRTAPTGAPLLYVDGQPAGRGVSLTDRAGCAVCLVAARDAAIGCDVEIIEPRSDAFARDYLTQAEQQLVGAAGPARHMAANLVWSAKESALKVLRTGLRRDTRSVEVDVAELNPPERAWSALRVRTAEGEVFPGWWRRSGPFLVTACWPGGGPPPGALEERSPIDTLLPSHRWLGRPVS